MVDFSNIKRQDITPETTREYEFDILEGEPSVIVAPAHDSNPAFLDERLRLASERAAKMAEERDEKKGKRKTGALVVTPEMMKKQLEEDRDYDRRIMAAACIRSWGETPPVDVDGNEVPFSPENALAFLEALPDYCLDPFRSFVANVYNFVKRPVRDAAGDAKLGE